MPPIRDGLMTNMTLCGRGGIARVVRCSGGVLAPGQTGTVLIRALLDDRDREAIRPGTKFELLNTPAYVWATCEITSVEEVVDDSKD